MSIDLTAYERGAPFPGDVDEALAALRDRLANAQLLQIGQHRRAIVLLEGREGAGKTAVLRQLAAALDPRFFSVCAIHPERRQQAEGHWLARFWAALPAAGHSTLFHHSWYTRVLEDRVLGLVTDKEWGRAYDEINEFEAQQRDYGTLLTKLYLHVSEPVRAERVETLEASPQMRALLGPMSLRTADASASYREAASQMFDQNHTRWSPWTVIDANDEDAALVAALGAIADGMEKSFPVSVAGEVRSVIDFKAPERA